MAKSSFQELMELVAGDVTSKDRASLGTLLSTLEGLRSTFDQDKDLLEAVIRKVESEIRSRH
jgi:hypothetical protein